MSPERTIQPQIIKLGVATEEDVGIDTLADRLRAEIGDDGAAVTWGFITAWTQGCGCGRWRRAPWGVWLGPGAISLPAFQSAPWPWPQSLR